MNSIILRTVSRIVFQLLLIIAVFLLVSGHNAPGGGFIAGLLAAASLVLLMLAFDLDYVQSLLPVNYINVVTIGLVLAAGVGFAPLLSGLPFLTSAFRTYSLPLIGAVELSSAVVFDVGVFLVVTGSVMTVIQGIAADSDDDSEAEEVRAALREDAELWRP